MQYFCCGTMGGRGLGIAWNSFNDLTSVGPHFSSMRVNSDLDTQGAAVENTSSVPTAGLGLLFTFHS